LKHLFILFSTFILVACSDDKKPEAAEFLQERTSYSFHIKPAQFVKTDSTNTLLLETTLWNNTKDTLKYVSMSCSWYDVYSISHPKVSIKQDPCFKNIPVIISVDPETNAKTFFKVSLDGIEQGSREKLKLGFKLIQAQPSDDTTRLVETLYNTKNTEAILWSNEIEL
jgi:hypothetical protein